MKTFLGILLMVGVALGGVFLFAPDRIKNQGLAALAFLGSSFDQAKKFVVGKADPIVNPVSSRERRAKILDELDTVVAKIENPQTPPAEKQRLAAQAQELIEEVKKHNEGEPGILGSLIGAVTGANQCGNP